ncbi:MAG: metallophosphoesterase [Clostridia bacterium]|nr:metallophosphoesterase [Clostridia bacterium]
MLKYFKYGFLRVISAIVAAVMLLAAGAAAGEAYDVKEPDKCLLNFSILSDVHIEGNNFARYQVFSHALQDVRRNKSGNDAVVFLGDNTMNGQFVENMLFHGAVSELLPDETVLPALGNHDVGNGEGDYMKLQNRWYDFTAAFFGRKLDCPYYYEVIDGYYFIVLGMQAQKVHEMYISGTQYEWLEDVLEKAAESGKPAFVFKHFPSDDVTDADGKYTDRLIDMLAAYNREHDLFSFVGHTHMPLHLSWSFHTDDGFPETYLPRLTELGGENDNEPIDRTGVGLEVEVYENEVVLRGRDFYRGAWEIDDWEDEENVLCERTYTLKSR